MGRCAGLARRPGKAGSKAQSRQNLGQGHSRGGVPPGVHAQDSGCPLPGGRPLSHHSGCLSIPQSARVTGRVPRAVTLGGGGRLGGPSRTSSERQGLVRRDVPSGPRGLRPVLSCLLPRAPCHHCPAASRAQRKGHRLRPDLQNGAKTKLSSPEAVPQVALQSWTPEGRHTSPAKHTLSKPGFLDSLPKGHFLMPIKMAVCSNRWLLRLMSERLSVFPATLVCLGPVGVCE